ncbi:MAG: hypothetical protein LBJ31_02540, partial [Treponema sp.]|nr:hypothetical protein [Treponema sp.]
PGAALVFTGNEADAELHLRVGGVLSRYEDETTAALGRTLILSVLSFSGINGAVPRRITVNTDASFNPSGEMISSAGVYRLCAAGPNYARSQELVSGASWAWTAATELGALVDGGVLDIAVTFPAGETHYMLIRGIRPFTTLQLHGTNYPPDSQFERYDNSGWVYSGSEQTLMVKLRHRTQVEHIRIQY